MDSTAGWCPHRPAEEVMPNMTSSCFRLNNVLRKYLLIHFWLRRVLGAAQGLFISRAEMCGLIFSNWDLSSPTRHQTLTPALEGRS